MKPLSRPSALSFATVVALLTPLMSAACTPANSGTSEGEGDAGEGEGEGEGDVGEGEGDVGEGEGDVGEGEGEGGEGEGEGEEGEGEGEGGGAAYITGCNSLLAVRIVEKQIEARSGFPESCEAPLLTNVGRFHAQGPAMCVVGESANACRDRLYAVPPSLTADLDFGCDPGVGCMRGVFVPPCVDGTDACTVGGGEPDAVCQDGTRPMIYAEQATAPVDPAGSNTWIFYLGAEGGPCDGDGCWFNYSHVDLAFQKAMSTSHPDYATNSTQIGSGVVNGATAQNPLASYNRVKFERCTDAASDTIEVVDAWDGVPPSLAERANPDEAIGTRSSPVPVWHKGLSTWSATFNHLANPAGTDLDANGTPDLPDLAAATTIVIAGSSDASQWLALAGDELAARARAVAPGATVRLVIDANFPPGIDNEGRYQEGAAADFNMFADAFVAGDTCVLPPGLDPTVDTACSQLNLAPGVGGAKTPHDTLDARNTFRDASCVAAHGVDSPQCSDKVHSMLFHIDTPLLVLADQEDPSLKGGVVPYANSQSYRWASELPFRTRMVDQARDLERFWNTTDREGRAGVTGDLMVVLPKARREGQPSGAATHVHLGANDTTNTRMSKCDADGTRLVSRSLSQLIDDWVAGDAPELFIYEDGLPSDGSPFWVTGGNCRAPE